MANIFKSKYTGEQIEEILDKVNNVTDITPNPTEEATAELQKITIGGTTYSIPKGITVEGNPSGDATTELTKLKVGNIIYSIPQGSGGGNSSNIDTSKMFTISTNTAGFYAGNILFGLVKNGVYYPIYPVTEFENLDGCHIIGCIFTNYPLEISNIVGTLVSADGTTISASNFNANKNKLLLLKSNVTIYGAF